MNSSTTPCELSPYYVIRIKGSFMKILYYANRIATSSIIRNQQDLFQAIIEEISTHLFFSYYFQHSPVNDYIKLPFATETHYDLCKFYQGFGRVILHTVRTQPTNLPPF